MHLSDVHRKPSKNSVPKTPAQPSPAEEKRSCEFPALTLTGSEYIHLDWEVLVHVSVVVEKASDRWTHWLPQLIALTLELSKWGELPQKKSRGNLQVVALVLMLDSWEYWQLTSIWCLKRSGSFTLSPILQYRSLLMLAKLPSPLFFVWGWFTGIILKLFLVYI